MRSIIGEDFIGKNFWVNSVGIWGDYWVVKVFCSLRNLRFSVRVIIEKLEEVDNGSRVGRWSLGSLYF